MAWITKNSAGMQIERRDEPYVDDELKQDMQDNVLPRYPTKQAATLPILHRIQEKHGYIPFQAIEEAADFLELPAKTVYDTATFYEEFFLEPKGKYTIWVCQSIACELMGQPTLMEQIEEHLGLMPGETSADGKFTLMHVECLGACGTAPVALVNEKLHKNLTADNFKRVLDGLD